MKKAQAAMEFLMTYGWAILVVLIAIAALAYFGVLNPSRYLPSSCTLVPGLSCEDFKVDGTAKTVELVIQNGMGQDLNPITISIAGACVGSAPDPDGDGLLDGEKDTFVIACASDIIGSKFKEDIKIGYTAESGLSHNVTGSLTTQIE